MPTAEQQIIEAEDRLRLAMLTSDCQTLDQLIAPDLIFTTHLGQVLDKQADLAMHRSGLLKFHSLEPSERQILLSGSQPDGSIAIVSVRMQLSGSYDGSPFTGDLRYTRIWCQSEQGIWQIVAGHSSAVEPSPSA